MKHFVHTALFFFVLVQGLACNSESDQGDDSSQLKIDGDSYSGFENNIYARRGLDDLRVGESRLGEETTLEHSKSSSLIKIKNISLEDTGDVFTLSYDVTESQLHEQMQLGFKVHYEIQSCGGTKYRNLVSGSSDVGSHTVRIAKGSSLGATCSGVWAEYRMTFDEVDDVLLYSFDNLSN